MARLRPDVRALRGGIRRRLWAFAASLLFCIAVVGLVAAGTPAALLHVARAKSKPLPLVVRSASFRLSSSRVAGTATVANRTRTRVAATEAALSWSDQSSGPLTTLKRVSVPRLGGAKSTKIKFAVKVPATAVSGIYSLSVCLDVGGKLQRFAEKTNCSAAGKVTVKRSRPPPGPAPDTTLTSAPSGVVRGATASFTFTSSILASMFECSLDGAPFATCSSPTQYTGLADGPHSFAVRAVASGVTDPSPAVASWTVDATGPTVTLTGPANGSTITNQTKPTFSGAAGTGPGDSSTVTVKVYSGSSVSGSPVQTLSPSVSGGSWSVSASSALADGTYTAQAEQSDSAGNTGKSSANTFTVEALPPKPTITSAPSGRVPIGPVSISFTANQAGSTFQCSVDSGAFATCESPYSVTNPTPGPHRFSVEATNQAGVTDSTRATASWSSVEPEHDLCGSLMGNMTIGPDYAARYVLTCNVDVPVLTTLTAQPGTIIKADTGAQLSVQGSLVAKGTSGSPITFTSINDNSVGGSSGSGSPAASDWAGIQASGSGSLDVEHAVVEYGTSVGGQGFASLVALNDTFSLDGGLAAVLGTGASVTVKNNSFVSPSGSAVVVSSPQLQLSGNTASGISSATVGGQAYWADSSALDFAALSSNTADAGGLVVSGSAVTSTWSGSIPLLLETGGETAQDFASSAVLDVPSGATLTLAPGTIVKGQGSYNGPCGDCSISVQGSLVAKGTSGSPITFTSINDNSVGGSTGQRVAGGG